MKILLNSNISYLYMNILSKINSVETKDWGDESKYFTINEFGCKNCEKAIESNSRLQ